MIGNSTCIECMCMHLHIVIFGNREVYVYIIWCGAIALSCCMGTPRPELYDKADTSSTPFFYFYKNNRFLGRMKDT